MGGVAKTFEHPLSSDSWIGKGITSANNVVTGKANIGDAINLFTYGSYKGAGLDKLVNGDKRSAPAAAGPGQAPMTDNPAQTLATTGGAPLLANIAMGASVEDSLAGYFGQSDYKSFYDNLDDASKKLVDGVKNQLTEIQSNTNLRNQAVQNIVNDFPNIAANAAKAQQDAKSAAGEEFDATTKGYIDQALNGAQAKLAAGGNLSSGAAAEAEARVGAQYGMDKLNYTNSRGDLAYNNTYSDQAMGWQSRYNEANALRSFQNTMTQGAAGQGFSAVQNMLGRTQQTNLANAGFANAMNLQNNQQAFAANNSNKDANAALFGTIGKVGGTVIGGIYGGPAGAAIGGSLGGAIGGYAGGQSGSNYL